MGCVGAAAAHPSDAGCGAPPYRVITVRLKFGKVVAVAYLFLLINSLPKREAGTTAGVQLAGDCRSRARRASSAGVRAAVSRPAATGAPRRRRALSQSSK